jgi:hypothetical protein
MKMSKIFTAKQLEEIIDRVAADPSNASQEKRAIRKMITAREPARDFSPRARRPIAELDDDFFDNMPV